MLVKRLVAKQARLTEELVNTFPEGYVFILLVDPETGRTYEPKPGWEVTGNNLEELFDLLDEEDLPIEWVDEIK